MSNNIFTHADALNLIGRLGRTLMALSDENTEPEELDEEIVRTLKAIKKAQDKLGVMPILTQSDINTFHAIGGAIAALTQPDTFAIQTTLSRVLIALADIQHDTIAIKMLTKSKELLNKDKATETTSSEIYKGLPCKSARGAECCDMIHIMKQTGFKEQEIRAGIFAFWTGVNMPHPLNR